MTNLRRGEIWLVDLNPTRGQEIQKTRPAVIISAEIFNPIPLRIIIPITSWQEKFRDRPFMVKIESLPENQLKSDSAGNVLQVRSISTERFVKQLGQVSDETLQELLSGLIICIDYEPRL
ncbi:MAG: type II toxin-antitoxin system PemK/MazF family toxin [Nostocaceae cyanobacterium]|nr:type II toxin-antitoxin system PemK/MazF family toxin [Nostocaceae cyanobacterium]